MRHGRARRRARGCACAGLLVAGLALGGCLTEIVEDEVPTVVVERSEEFVRNIAADGNLEAVEATPVGAPPDAETPMKIAWIADDGTAVSKGDVVVRFDASLFERKLADGRDDARSAERQIAKEKLVGTSARHKRERTAEVAVDEVAVARDFEIDDESIMSRVDLVEAAIDLEMAQARVDHSQKVEKIEGTVSSGKVAVHQIARDQAQREIARTGEALDRLSVVAPHDGILVLEKDWQGNSVRVGDTVWPGQPLAQIPLVTGMQAQVFVLEASAGALAPGLPAQVVLDAHPDVVYTAEVARVDTLAQPRHPDVPVQYFGVTLELEKTDVSTMRVGQRVRATIVARQGEAVVVPRQAVFEREGKRIVYRAAAGDFEPVEVEIGVSSAGRIQIVAGIEVGDRIALRDPTRPATAPGEAGEGPSSHAEAPAK